MMACPNRDPCRLSFPEPTSWAIDKRLGISLSRWTESLLLGRQMLAFPVRALTTPTGFVGRGRCEWPGHTLSVIVIEVTLGSPRPDFGSGQHHTYS